jgi:hypothetical protein
LIAPVTLQYSGVVAVAATIVAVCKMAPVVGKAMSAAV